MMDFAELVRRFREIEDFSIPASEPPEVLSCTVYPPVAWEQRSVEETLQIRTPSDLQQFWQMTAGAHLFENSIHGQWGLVILSPAQVVNLPSTITEYWREELIPGDLIIGHFVGDPDLLILRCDPNEPDFGQVIVALAIAHRNEREWFIAASSFGDFLQRYLVAQSDWFWEDYGKATPTPRVGPSAHVRAVIPEGRNPRVSASQRVRWNILDRIEYRKRCERERKVPRDGWASWELHHIRPRMAGGDNSFENIVPVSPKDHLRFTQWWKDW